VIEASEAEDKLARAVEELSFDPRRLEEAETRLFEIRAMARKHKVAPDDLGALAEELTARFQALQAGGGRIAGLEAERSAARARYDEAASALSAARSQAAARLDEAVAAELRPLKLGAARFRTTVKPLDEQSWGEAGRDRVEFEISTNPGAPFAPLVKDRQRRRVVALHPGAQGRAGRGRKRLDDDLRRDRPRRRRRGRVRDRRAPPPPGDQAQLLVVTHSPQVAARGARHLLIEKSHQGLVTRTSVQALDDTHRREEIARMLSGAQVTEEARAQATRLLEVV
jgi:DNA repair protein RecN (Recombination protein N)